MALSLLDEYPLLSVLNGNSHRRNRPLMLSVLDHLESQLNQRVGQVFRRLPSVFMELDDDFETTGNGRKRKLVRGSDIYEPKPKFLVTTKDGRYQVKLDTSNYKPDEITVKVVNDRLSISAKHETKTDNCYEFHEMQRSFDLPEGVDPQSVVSSLSSGGQLTIEAPLPLKQKETVTERLVPVEISNEQKTPEKNSDKSKGTSTKNSENE